MKHLIYFFYSMLVISLAFIHCKTDPSVNSDLAMSLNAFDSTGSDPEAIWVADDAIAASGGVEAWTNTKIIKWNFFGRRWLLWDKEHGKVRIENVTNDTKFILDIHSKQGKVYKDGKEWTDKDTLTKYLEMAYRTWINDSYWLAMPFKMKDPGVHLRYIKEDTTLKGIACDVISLTFDSVGVTPKNKYEVWVGKNSSLVAQWAYFPNFQDSIPSIVSPWDSYVKYGNIFLSGDRGDKRQFTGIKVFETLPASIFENFDPIDFSTL